MQAGPVVLDPIPGVRRVEALVAVVTVGLGVVLNTRVTALGRPGASATQR